MKRSKKIIIWLAVALFAAAQAIALFLLIRTVPASALMLSETAVTLKRDEGRRIDHTVEPRAARGKLLAYRVSASDEIVAWIDDKNEMLVGVSPGTCTITAKLDGLEAKIEVTVLDETVLAGEWVSEDGMSLSIGADLSGTLVIGSGSEPVQWMRGSFGNGESGNAWRYTKLTASCGGTYYVLYYDRLNDTVRLRGTDAPDRLFVRG